jgi:hypothetical protein
MCNLRLTIWFYKVELDTIENYKIVFDFNLDSLVNLLLIFYYQTTYYLLPMHKTQ